MAIMRKRLAEIPNKWTRDVKARVKKMKLESNPKMTGRGRLVLTDKMAGRTGKIQGDKTVAKPANSANSKIKYIN
jgi:hypothetical protein